MDATTPTHTTRRRVTARLQSSGSLRSLVTLPGASAVGRRPSSACPGAATSRERQITQLVERAASIVAVISVALGSPAPFAPTGRRGPRRPPVGRAPGSHSSG